MQATQTQGSSTGRATPKWVWAALVIGAGVMLLWAWFLLSFISEPSAKGRPGAVLVSWAAASVASALVAGLGAIGLRRREAWARPLAWIASIAMTITCVGAVAGIPTLIALLSSRSASKI